MRTIEPLRIMAERGREYRDWYREAHSHCVRLCNRHEWDLQTFIDVIALFSPRVQVRRNLRMAMHYMQTKKQPPGCLRSVMTSVKHWEKTGEIRGQKVAAFSKCLHGCKTSVVLDTWMARALACNPHHFANRKVRDKATQRIVQVASILDWEPRQAQAAIWATEVQRRGRNVPTFRE